jgi:hypothetical protein
MNVLRFKVIKRAGELEKVLLEAIGDVGKEA